MNISLSPFAPENLVSRDRFGSPPVPRHFLPSSVAASIYLFKPPFAIGSVPSSSGHAIAHSWRSLARVRRHRASKPQASSEQVLPWQVTHGAMNMRLSYANARKHVFTLPAWNLTEHLICQVCMIRSRIARS